MIERNAKTFLVQLLKMCTTQWASCLVSTVALVITAPTCQLLSLSPKKVTRLFYVLHRQNFIAQSIVPRHELSSSSFMLIGFVLVA